MSTRFAFVETSAIDVKLHRDVQNVLFAFRDFS